MSEKTTFRIVSIGIITSVVGVFLPWGYYPANIYVALRYGLGFQLLTGTILLGSSIIALVILSFSRKWHSDPWRIPVSVCALIAISLSLAWILTPDAFAFYWTWSQGAVTIVKNQFIEAVYYGAYISLAGSIIALTGLA